MRLPLVRLVLVTILFSSACGSRPAPASTATLEPAAATVAATATRAATATLLATATTANPTPTMPPVTPSPVATTAPTVAPVPTAPTDPCQAAGTDQAGNLSLSYTAARSDGLGSSVYAVRADGSQATELVQGGLAPSWSANGQRLAYLVETGNQDRPYTLHLVWADGTSDTGVTLDFAVDAARGARWSPDGNRLALDSPNGGVYVVDAQTGEVTNVAGSLPLASGPVWSPDGARLAFQAPLSVTLNNLYRVYTVDANGSNLTRLDSATLNDFVQQWQPGGSRLLVKSGADAAPQQVYLVSLDGADRQWLFGGQTYTGNIAWSPNAKQMAYLASEIHFDQQRNITGSTEWLVVASADGANPRTLQQLELAYGQRGFGAPEWSPDGRYLAYSRGAPDSASGLYALDVCTGKETQVASGAASQTSWKPGPPLREVRAVVASPAVTPAPEGSAQHDFAYALAWSPDGQRLAAGTSAGVRFYDSASLTETVLLPNSGACCTLAVLGARYLASLDGHGTGVSVYDWQDQSLIFQQKDEPELTFQSVALSPDDSLLATGERYQVRLWDLPSGDLRATLQTSDQADSLVTNVGFTTDGRTLVSVTQWLGVVQRWDVATLKLRHSFRIPKVTSFILGPGAKRLLVDYAKPGFELWEVATGALLGRHPKIISAGGPAYTAFSPDGRRIAVWGYKTDQGNTLAVWDIGTDKVLHEFGLPASSSSGPEWRSAAFSPDGRTLALGDSDGNISVYETDTWTETGRTTVAGDASAR